MDVIIHSANIEAGDLRFHVGGEQYYYTLLEPIELLAIVEEAAVRDAVRTAHDTSPSSC